jgi:hypothetical protein
MQINLPKLSDSNPEALTVGALMIGALLLVAVLRRAV